jgi:hypothetical protein
VLIEQPDHTLVWNHVQACEATTFHGISRESVRIVGAANFDRFFGEVEAAALAPRRVAEDGRATILYLGSWKVSNVEPYVFARWLAALRASGDPLLREARVVVRPHPTATLMWTSWERPDDPLLSLELATKHQTVSLAEALRDADAVVALNTTAEIEAAIAGRQVVTFRAGLDEAPGQQGLLHFWYLLEGRGGFVIDCPDLDDHLAKLGRVVRGEYDGERISRFVERFVRPHGLDRPVAPIVAATVLELTAERTPVPAAARA